MKRRFAFWLCKVAVVGLGLLPVLAGAQQQPSGSTAPQLSLLPAPAKVHTEDINYLEVDGKTFQATVYQPEGPGPFPAILDVHGGAWVREDVRRDEHKLLATAIAAMGVVVVSIDYRQSPQNHYPDSAVDVNYALRWLRANAPKFNASQKVLGALGSSSGGHLVLLNALHPADARYVAPPLDRPSSVDAKPDYVLLVYPISDPLARRAYAVKVENNAPVKATDTYFAPAGSLQDGNPQLILDRHELVTLPPMLLLQGSAGTDGVVKDKNVSPEIQERFVASYRAAGGSVELVMLAGAGHNFVNTGGPHFDQAVGLMKTFIQQQLARQ
jgi:acetyl esterase/lipase